jgi:hypothetical protein
VASLDLVLSVDNSTVHLAGAVGTPVWTMLPFASDWRWLLEYEDTPWYPSMRLFRQTEIGLGGGDRPRGARASRCYFACFAQLWIAFACAAVMTPSVFRRFTRSATQLRN